MAKESGIGHYLFLAGYDLSGDVGMIDSIMCRRAPLKVTGIDKSAVERISGLRDGEINFNSWFNPAAAQEHPALSTLPTTDRIVQYFAGATVGQNVAAMIGKQINYDSNHGADGSLAFSVQALANGFGVEWGDMLTTGKQTFASTGTGTSFDYGAAASPTAFGAVAYLQVFSIGSSTCTVAVQDSTDGSTGWANVTGLAFAAATGQTSERVATATNASVKRWLRLNLTGAFTNAVIAVSVCKFLSAQG